MLFRSAAKISRAVFIATDPDREGEAIAWHVHSQIKGKHAPPIKRVLFHEITKDAVNRAIDRAGDIDQQKVDAQQARRVLDRLVGYKASPVLWKTVKKGLSAGRVQTVALRILVEREREIRAFNPVEYWTIAAALSHDGQAFTAKLHHLDGNKPIKLRGVVTKMEWINPHAWIHVDVKGDDGKVAPFEVKVGDRVLISKYGGTEVKLDDKKYTLVREDDILGVIG